MIELKNSKQTYLANRQAELLPLAGRGHWVIENAYVLCSCVQCGAFIEHMRFIPTEESVRAIQFCPHCGEVEVPA